MPSNKRSGIPFYDYAHLIMYHISQAKQSRSTVRSSSVLALGSAVSPCAIGPSGAPGDFVYRDVPISLLVIRARDDICRNPGRLNAFLFPSLRGIFFYCDVHEDSRPKRYILTTQSHDALSSSLCHGGSDPSTANGFDIPNSMSSEPSCWAQQQLLLVMATLRIRRAEITTIVPLLYLDKQ